MRSVRSIAICSIFVALLSCQAFAAMEFPGSTEAVREENNPVLVETARIRIFNVASGTIEVSSDKGASWRPVGRVLYPTSSVSNNGYTASKWIGDGAVAATAVNAIHIKTDFNTAESRGVIFSILPIEQRQVPSYYNSYLSPDSSIYTDIHAGTAIFGGMFSPYVGNAVDLQDPSGEVKAIGKGYVPREGDVLVIAVTRPKEYPKEIVFENRFAGIITEKYPDGRSKVIGTVLRPVIGVGRFMGTQYSDTGRIRANHPGVIDISTSPLGKVGGFQIIPAEHGMSDEMVKARTSTQWMVVGPVAATDPSPEGIAPLFKFFLCPRYEGADILDPSWESIALERFIVDVKLKGSDAWQAMPDIYIDPDLTKPIPSWAGRAFEKVTHVRILFPLR